MTLNELAKRCHNDAESMGWYDEGKTKSDLELLLMIITEVVETVEELRKPEPQMHYYNSDKPTKPEGVAVELADTIIRLLDFCAYKQIDIEQIISEKLKYNLTRGFRHGNKQF